jgi:hypothetical protein
MKLARIEAIETFGHQITSRAGSAS